MVPEKGAATRKRSAVGAGWLRAPDASAGAKGRSETIRIAFRETSRFSSRPLESLRRVRAGNSKGVIRSASSASALSTQPLAAPETTGIEVWPSGRRSDGPSSRDGQVVDSGEAFPSAVIAYARRSFHLN